VALAKRETGAGSAKSPTARPQRDALSYFLAAKLAFTVKVAEPPSGAGNVIE
jgi:hypothetical protein